MAEQGSKPPVSAPSGTGAAGSGKTPGSADVVSDRQSDKPGVTVPGAKGQEPATLDLNKKSVISNSEAERRERNDEQIVEDPDDETAKGFKNPRGAFVGADDRKPESGEFDPETGGPELKDRKAAKVGQQQRRDYERIQSQMLRGDGGEPLEAGVPRDSVGDGQSDQQREIAKIEADKDKLDKEKSSVSSNKSAAGVGGGTGGTK